MGFFSNLRNRAKKSVVTSSKPKVSGVNKPTKIFTPGANFERYHITYEEVVKKNAKVTLKWRFTDKITAADIVEIRPGCKCTADITWDEDGVTAIFTNQEKDADLKMTAHQISKTMRVYYNDGIGRVPNGRNGMSWAPEKFSEVLQFTGMVSR